MRLSPSTGEERTVRAISSVELIYLQADGRYRQQKGKITSDWPLYAMTTRQMHTLTSHPILEKPPNPWDLFATNRRPRKFLTWEELEKAEPPSSEKRLRDDFHPRIIVEDNNFLPLAPGKPLDLATVGVEIQVIAKEAALQAEQTSGAKIAQEGMIHMGIAFLAGVILLAMIVIGFLVLDLRFGGDDTPPVTIITQPQNQGGQ